MQIERKDFELALKELGHDPDHYRGKKISLQRYCDDFEINKDDVITAIERHMISAHYDYKNDEIWLDALDGAHFYYCARSKSQLFKLMAG